MKDIEIRFQEAVLAKCDQIGADANNLTDRDWERCYDLLTEKSFQSLVTGLAMEALNG